MAVVSGQTTLVRAMIEKDKDRCMVAKFHGGWTALHLTAAHRGLAILRFLIAEVADLSCRDDGHHTALDMAAIGVQVLAGIHRTPPSLHLRGAVLATPFAS